MNDLSTRDERLRPAASIDIADVLTRKLFLAFQMKGPEDEQQRKELLVIYVEALSKYPLWAIRDAVDQFIRGEVKAATKKWAPTPAELCEVVRGILDPVRREIQKREDLARRDADLHSVSDISDAERARVKLKMAVQKVVGLERTAELIRTRRLIPWIEEARKHGIEIPAGLVDPQDEMP